MSNNASGHSWSQLLWVEKSVSGLNWVFYWSNNKSYSSQSTRGTLKAKALKLLIKLWAHNSSSSKPPLLRCGVEIRLRLLLSRCLAAPGSRISSGYSVLEDELLEKLGHLKALRIIWLQTSNIITIYIIYIINKIEQYSLTVIIHIIHMWLWSTKLKF